MILAVLVPSAAQAHKDDYLTDTFVFVTLDRNEIELEYFLDGRFSPRALGHRLGVEYGVSDHLMGDVAASWLQYPGGPAVFSEGFLEARYRFGEENQHLLDPAAFYRVPHREGSGGRRNAPPARASARAQQGLRRLQRHAESRLRDRPPEAERVRPRDRPGPPIAGFCSLRAGLEVRRELATENVFNVIPQAWLRFSDDAYVKIGVGKNLAGGRESFVRVVLFKMEFEGARRKAP